MSIYPMPRPEERHSIPELIRQLFTEMTELIQQHIELTKTEVREEGKRASRAVIYALLGLLFLQVILIFLGNLLMLFLMVNNVTLLGATLITLGVFFVLALICVGLCFQQIRSAQNILKQEG